MIIRPSEICIRDLYPSFTKAINRMPPFQDISNNLSPPRRASPSVCQRFEFYSPYSNKHPPQASGADDKWQFKLTYGQDLALPRLSDVDEEDATAFVLTMQLQEALQIPHEQRPLHRRLSTLVLVYFDLSFIARFAKLSTGPSFPDQTSCLATQRTIRSSICVKLISDYISWIQQQM